MADRGGGGGCRRRSKRGEREREREREREGRRRQKGVAALKNERKGRKSLCYYSLLPYLTIPHIVAEQPAASTIYYIHHRRHRSSPSSSIENGGGGITYNTHESVGEKETQQLIDRSIVTLGED